VSRPPGPWPYPFWIAHRGAGKLAPENTLAAFRLGAQYGYRMFECDVKLSADGQPFLMHDAELQRTTNSQGVGGEKNWAELALLDAGSWHSRTYAGEVLPSLQAIAAFCLRNHHFLNIEIKPTPGTEGLTGEVVARQAAQLWRNAPHPPLLSSFQPDALAAAQASEAGLPRALLVDSLRPGWLDEAQQLGCCAAVLNYRLWEPALVAQVHDRGLRCLSYTVNDAPAADHIQSLGTDGIITDRVELFAPD
jgi:glycerophosphoryl diester phosphodiesterase